MADEKNFLLPQEGTSRSAGGESLSASEQSGVGCPSYSGGGIRRHKGQASDPDVDAHMMEERIPSRTKSRESSVSRSERSLDGSVQSLTEVGNISVYEFRSDSDSAMETCVDLSDGVPKKGRKRPGSEDSLSEKGKKAPKVPASKRGRGRPPTTGQYIGLAQAKAEQKFYKRETTEREAEEEALRTAQVSKELIPVIRDLPAESLGKEIDKALNTILDVAQKSKNLKGGFVKALNVAHAIIKEGKGALIERTSSEENAALQAQLQKEVAENARLRKELNELREGQNRLRADMDQITHAPPTPPMERLLEVFHAKIMVDIANMVEAKIDGRLTPDRPRPPLRGDSRPVPINMKAGPSNVKTFEAPSQQLVPKSLRPPPPSQDGSWVDVARRGRKTVPNARQAPPAAAPAQAGGSLAKASASAKRKNKRKQRKNGKKKELQPPRTAAVVLTLPDEAIKKGLTYEGVLSQARAKIKLEDLGIPMGLNCRKAATGARMFELPEIAGEDKADLLARKLKEVLPAEVRVTRPTKCAEMRVSGLDDTVTKEDVLAAVVLRGNCSKEHVRVGEVRHRGTYGSGAIWLQCPVAAAKGLAESGRLLVGWSSARVQLLETRPMRCFRCFEAGHTGLRCPSDIDRSRLCFRCGKPGHMVVNCTAEPHCPLCDEAGKPANHVVGGKKCHPPKRKGKQVGKNPAQALKGVGSREEVMDT